MRRTVRPGDFNITARFADGQIFGHSGVNTFGGPYTVGPRHAFKAGLPGEGGHESLIFEAMK
jgi:hypothetical protein